ncbi:MAG: DUF4234 domain-containing protein [Nitrospirae bacterium]|nr:MAG: DUF4234 domain-containing protein [Nitrospirota bacterium]
MFCRYCGSEKKGADDMFCSECGKAYRIVQNGSETGISQQAIPEPVSTQSASSQPELKKLSLFKIVFFACITLGIYPPVWFIRRKDIFNRLISTKKIGSGLPVLAIVFFAVGLIASIMAMVFVGRDISASAGFSALANFVNIAGYIILIIMSFRCRRILIDHFNGHLQRGIPFSGAATFFFGVLYLQYKINRL